MLAGTARSRGRNEIDPGVVGQAFASAGIAIEGDDRMAELTGQRRFVVTG